MAQTPGPGAGLRQLRVLGRHRLRRVDLPEQTSSWIEAGPFDLDIHVHGHAVVTCRRLPACAAEPQTVRVCTDPGPGVDERLNLNQRVRGPNGRPLGCVELACLWLHDRVAHQARVRQGEARPDAFDYRGIGSPEVLHRRADQALALRALLRHESRPVHLVADSRSGEWLQVRMDRMAAQGRSSSHYGLSSLHHAMALELAIETELQAQGGPPVPRWVVRLYDPDHTTLHLEWFAHDRNDLLPLRIGVVWLQRRVMFGESFRSSLRVSLALAPTLIFTLVLAAIMRERFQIPAVLFGALLLYAALTTLLPSLVFRTPFDVDPVEQEPAGEGEAAPVAATEALPAAPSAER